VQLTTVLPHYIQLSSTAHALRAGGPPVTPYVLPYGRGESRSEDTVDVKGR